MAGFKSLAQRDRCKKMVEEGLMDQATFDKYDSETDIAKIPERKNPKKEKK